MSQELNINHGFYLILVFVICKKCFSLVASAEDIDKSCKNVYYDKYLLYNLQTLQPPNIRNREIRNPVPHFPGRNAPSPGVVSQPLC